MNNQPQEIEDLRKQVEKVYMDCLPNPNTGLYDVKTSIDRIMLILSTAQNKARIDELKRLTGFSEARGICTMGENAFDPPIKVSDRINQLKKEV